MAPESSSRLVAALSDPGCYPHRPIQVELRETAISWLFLAGDLVYKIKAGYRALR
jgi:aminoglycoside phosphotransferase family enzyme